jgi:hypothetical protein
VCHDSPTERVPQNRRCNRYLQSKLKGEVVWSVRVGMGGTSGGVRSGMSTDGEHLLPEVSAWKRVRGVSGPTYRGEVTSLYVADGSQV